MSNSAAVHAVATHSATNFSPATEPVCVFGSNLGGSFESGDGAFAVNFHGAVPGKGFGPQGNSYAIPIQDSTYKVLALETIENYVNEFLNYAARNPHKNFQVLRLGCNPGEYKDEEIAELFRRGGANVRLPGIWLRILKPGMLPRIIIHDPEALLRRPDIKCLLDKYFSVNLPRWRVPKVEIVSTGQSRSMVANDQYARAHGYAHRVMGARQDYYGVETELARNMKAICYATHLVCFVDPDQTSDCRHVRLISIASRHGLTVEEVKITKTRYA